MAFGDFTVTRASTKNILGSDGLYQSVANNVPAFEFNTDGTYRGLLVEPGATNLVPNSQVFSAATWNSTGVVITDNATTAPDGTTTAELFTEDGSTGLHAGGTVSNYGSAGVHTWSIYAKPNGRDWLAVRIEGVNSWFNISTGALGTNGAGNTQRIEALPNGWYRCSVTRTLAGTTAFGYRLGNANNVDSYTGDGTSGIFIWQAQLETGSVATSPIVTTAGTASRVADSVVLTGASSLIGQSAGTIFVEAEYIPDGTGRALLNLSASGDDTTRTNNRFVLGAIPSNQFEFRTVVGGVNQCEIISGARTASILKIAGTYAVNDFAFYINGSSIGTDTLGTVPTCANIYLGANILNAAQYRGWIRSVALFPTRLANATLESITTL